MLRDPYSGQQVRFIRSTQDFRPLEDSGPSRWGDKAVFLAALVGMVLLLVL
jgi:hypothetical protein